MTTKLTNSLRNSISEEQKNMENKKFNDEKTISETNANVAKEAQVFSDQIAQNVLSKRTRKVGQKTVDTNVSVEVKANPLAVALVDAVNHLPIDSKENADNSYSSMANIGYNFFNVIMKNFKSTNENFTEYLKQLPKIKNFYEFRDLNANCLKSSFEQQTKFFNDLKEFYTFK